ncbi:MAG: hypothetical protein Q7R54_02455 [bacterium]|nr:hypothetical protein [bacterium]
MVKITVHQHGLTHLDRAIAFLQGRQVEPLFVAEDSSEDEGYYEDSAVGALGEVNALRFPQESEAEVLRRFLYGALWHWDEYPLGDTSDLIVMIKLLKRVATESGVPYQQASGMNMPP